MKIRTQWEPNVSSPYGYVYVTHNIAEDVYYCGKHKASAFDETYFGSGTLLKKAMSKQNVKDFVCVPIDWAESADELHEKEVSWIKYFNAVSDPQWYNLIEDSNNYQEYIDQNFTDTREGVNKTPYPFFKGFSTLVEFLQPGSHLSKNSYQLMLYFLIYSGYKNKLYYSRNAIAKATGIKPTAISRAFNELLKVGFCLKLNTSGFCLLNPYFSFRGTDPQPIQRWFNKEQDDQSRERMKKAMSETSPFSKNTKKENTEEKKRKKPKPTNDLKSQIAKSDAKTKILEYLLSKKDQNNDVFRQVKELVDELNLSKVTIIQFLTMLQADGYISRPARGHIKLLRVNDLKRLLR